MGLSIYIFALIFKSKRDSPENQVAHGQKGHTVRPSHPGEVVLATCHWHESHVVLLRFWNSVPETHEPIGRRQKLWKHLRGLAMDETKTIEWNNERRWQERRCGKNATELRNMDPIVTEESFFFSHRLGDSTHFPGERLGKLLRNYKLMLALCENRSSKTTLRMASVHKGCQKGNRNWRERRKEESKKILKSLSCLTCGPQIKQKSAQCSLLLHFG